MPSQISFILAKIQQIKTYYHHLSHTPLTHLLSTPSLPPTHHPHKHNHNYTHPHPTPNHPYTHNPTHTMPRCYLTSVRHPSLPDPTWYTPHLYPDPYPHLHAYVLVNANNYMPIMTPILTPNQPTLSYIYTYNHTPNIHFTSTHKSLPNLYTLPYLTPISTPRSLCRCLLYDTPTPTQTPTYPLTYL